MNFLSFIIPGAPGGAVGHIGRNNRPASGDEPKQLPVSEEDWMSEASRTDPEIRLEPRQHSCDQSVYLMSQLYAVRRC